MLRRGRRRRPNNRVYPIAILNAVQPLCRVQEFPLGCIAPVTVLWSPPDPGINSGGDYEESEGNTTAEEEEIRRVWLWVHPAAAEEALRQLRKACVVEGAPWARNIEVCQRVS